MQKMVTNIFQNPHHVFWALFQQFGSRGFVAVKWLIVARLLGPEQFGVFSASLLILAISDALSQIGVSTALIQGDEPNKRKSNAAWTFLLLRGATVSIILLISTPFLDFFVTEEIANIFIFFSLIPLMKNSYSIGYVLSQKNRDFRRLAFFENGVSILDIFFSLLFIILNMGVYGVAIGALLAVFLAALLSHFIFPYKNSINFEFHLIKDYIKYGRWIWSHSIINLIIFQFDKVLVFYFLGTLSLGYYQMALKISQILVYDLPFALGNYLFPSFAETYHRNSDTLSNYFIRFFIPLVASILAIAVILTSFANEIIIILLGADWQIISPVFVILVWAAFFSAISVPFVALNRAIGKPEVITFAISTQLVIFVTLSCILIQKNMSLGVAISSFIGNFIFLAILSINTIVLFMNFDESRKNDNN